jgi:hypothetical protein
MASTGRHLWWYDTTRQNNALDISNSRDLLARDGNSRETVYCTRPSSAPTGIWNGYNNPFKIVQEAQKVALGQIFAVGVSTSMGAMLLVAGINSMTTRNQLLHAKFSGRLHHERNAKIPLVKMYDHC